jgi:hypothetical protein
LLLVDLAGVRGVCVFLLHSTASAASLRGRIRELLEEPASFAVL